MSYEPTVWQAGDVVTSAKLNKIENGIADSSVFLVNYVYDDFDPEVTPHLDKTYTEIKNAFLSGKKVIALLAAYEYGDDDSKTLRALMYYSAAALHETLSIPEIEQNASYCVRFIADDSIKDFTADDPDGALSEL